MWPYFLMFLGPAWLAMQEKRTSSITSTSAGSNRIPLTWWYVYFLMTLLIGLRHKVGGDWSNYVNNLQGLNYASFESIWLKGDPGYRMLEWTSLQLNWGIHGVNFLGAIFFSYGLVKFCLSLPRPWLALTVAIPYLVIIVAMGYTRQGIAVGCIMAGLVALGQGRILIFVIWAVLGATFHKSAVLVLPMAALAASQRRWLTAIWVSFVVATAYTLLLEDSVDALTTNYLETGYQSEGALVRLLMNIVPATILLWQRKYFHLDRQQSRLWLWFSLAALALMIMYFVSPSSTAVDRIGLYLLPLQLMVFSHLPAVLGRGPGNQRNWVHAILLYYACVELVWLNFAIHAFAWLPYRFYPLVDLF